MKPYDSLLDFELITGYGITLCNNHKQGTLCLFQELCLSTFNPPCLNPYAKIITAIWLLQQCHSFITLNPNRSIHTMAQTDADIFLISDPTLLMGKTAV